MFVIHLCPPDHQQALDYARMLIAAAHNEGCTMAMATTQEEFRQLCKEEKPTVVHVHAALPFHLPSGHRIVLTPHGENPRPGQVYVVIARSAMERKRLEATFPRVEIISNPLITRTITPQACLRQLMAVYSRVADTDVRPLMTVHTRRAMAAAIAAAIGEDPRWAPDDSTSDIALADMRQIFVYASAEGVLPIVQYGLSLLGTVMPQQQPAKPYLPPAFTVPQPLLNAKGASLNQQATDILTDIQHNGPSLLRLVELSTLFHDDNFEPDELLPLLDDNRQRHLLAALLPLLAAETLLTEGFMPCTPSGDAEAARMRQLFEQRQRVATAAEL